MARTQRVNPLVEGAFLAVITAILGALAIYFLPVKFLVDYIWGIPLIIIIKRHNLRTGIMTLVTTFLITWLFTDPVTTLLLVIELAPLAVAYGIMFKKEVSPGTVLLGGSAVSVFSTVLTVLGFIYLAKISIIPSEQVLRMQAQQAMDMYVKFGLVKSADAKTIIDGTVKLMRILIPSALAIASIIRSFLSYILAVKVLRKLNYKVEPLPPFSEWRLPWYSVWVFIVALALSLLGDEYKISALAAIGKNAVFIVVPLFFIIGLSVITKLLKSWNLGPVTKVLLGIVAFVNFSGTFVLLTLIGLFDPLMTFRNWKRPAE